MTITNVLSRLQLPIILSLLAFVLAVVPMDFFHCDFPHFDKIAHATVFGILTLVFTRALSIRKSVFVVLMLSTSFEVAQQYIPSRTANVDDIVANCVGIIWMWILVCLLTHFKYRILKRS